MYEDLKPDTNTLEPNGDDWRKAWKRRMEMLQEKHKTLIEKVDGLNVEIKSCTQAMEALTAVLNLAEAKAERRLNGADSMKRERPDE